MVELKNIAHLALNNNLWHIIYSSVIRENSNVHSFHQSNNSFISLTVSYMSNTVGVL